MLGLRVESGAFLTALLTGMIVTCAYSCIRKFRRLIPHPPVLIGVEDVLYWIGTAVYIFLQIYHTSSGNIRWYFVTGTSFGIFAYALAEKLVRRAGERLSGKRKNKS